MHRTTQPSRPLWLFLKMTDVFELSWSDRWLLWRIARQAKLPSGMTLLLSRGALLTHADAYAAGLSDHRRKRVLERVARMASSLFD